MLDVEASRETSDCSAAPTRGLVLQQAAVRTARTWTSAWFRALAGDGRRVEGGWPGTVPEARARIASDAARTLEGLSMAALTRDELSRVTRMTYEEARRLWRANAAPAG